MPVTVDDIKEQIVLELGDLTASGDPVVPPALGVVGDRIDWLWARYAAKDLVLPGLRELYVKHAGLRLLLGVLAPRVLDVTGIESSFKANQLWGHYTELLKQTDDAIALAESLPRRARGYRGGRIATRVPGRPGLPLDPEPRLARAAFDGGLVLDTDDVTGDDD